ncbi:MAG TPA: hypothetical protein VK473_11125 [Terriglobales bacterium]|nr:hypothetical protein [Terriglobales bacterium]
MRRFGFLLALLLSGSLGFAAALGTATRTVIPGQVQQIIAVDYRALHNSPTAMALKDRVLPDNLKQFEASLRSFGLNPDQDVEQLIFAAYRLKENATPHLVGIAQGPFPTSKLLQRIRLRKIAPEKYRTSSIYPMSNGMSMTLLDAYTMLFGERSAVKGALDARDGEAENLSSNPEISDMIASVESGDVWSVLDAVGTQNMMRSTLGDAAQLTDYNAVKKRLLGSRYTMDFTSGVNFDLAVLTSDNMTAATLSSLIKAGVLYKKMTATAVEKVALDNVTIDSDSSLLRLHFKTDDKQFQSLLQSPLFAAVSR